jgi:hypothetical protein
MFNTVIKLPFKPFAFLLTVTPLVYIHIEEITSLLRLENFRFRRGAERVAC